MQSGSNYTYITGAATTVIGPANSVAGAIPQNLRRICLMGFAINKTLVGTLTIKSGATTIGSFAIGTPVGFYWYAGGGIEINDLQIINSAGEDITVAWYNL